MAKKKSDSKKGCSGIDVEKIRQRAAEIWKSKCQSLNTALDDWLQAERELKAQTGFKHKTSDQYTPEEIARIRERAQAIRDEKIRSLRTAFDDWIQAEQELKEELQKKVNLKDLFDMWFTKVSPHMASLLDEDTAARRTIFDDALGKEYIELMAECMT